MSMHKLKVVPGSGITTLGTKVYVDEQEIKGVTGLTLVAKAEDVWRATLEMNVTIEGLQIENTDLTKLSRTYVRATKWQMVKAFLGMP